MRKCYSRKDKEAVSEYSPIVENHSNLTVDPRQGPVVAFGATSIDQKLPSCEKKAFSTQLLLQNVNWTGIGNARTYYELIMVRDRFEQEKNFRKTS